MLDLHKESFAAHVDIVSNRWKLTARDWWNLYEDADPDYVNNEDDPEFDDQLDGLNFYAYYRCYPARDQDIAVVGTNPKFSPDGPGDDVFDFAELAGDFEGIQKKSVSTMKNYFTGDLRKQWLGVDKDGKETNLGGVFRPLATETEYFNEKEYVKTDFFDDQFYDSVYYTNLFKFGSRDFGSLTDSDEASELGARFLKRELDRVSPDVVIMLGQTLGKVTDCGKITDIHGTHQNYEGHDVIPHIHPSGYDLRNASATDYERYRATVSNLLG